MVLEYPATIVSNLMTGGRQWQAAGYGSDRRDVRRRQGRPHAVGFPPVPGGSGRLQGGRHQRPEPPPAVAERAIKQGTTVLVQPVGTKATQAAQRGETGTVIATDYLGHRALQAYARSTSRDWTGSSSRRWTPDEAFAPERNFAHKLVRSTALIIFLACLAAMVWSRLFVRPIKRLEGGAGKSPPATSTCGCR